MITLEAVNSLGWGEKLACKCEECSGDFLITKSLARRVLKGTKTAKFCSHKCSSNNKKSERRIDFSCFRCNVVFQSRVCDKKCSRVFCSHSCANKTISSERRAKKNCQHCNEDSGSKKFCSRRCQSGHLYEKSIRDWKAGNKVGYMGKAKGTQKWLRTFLFGKYKNKCCKCGWSQINSVSGKIPLEVNHIDGDAENCKEENLELICPNCHSLTPNFRSLNKNSKRNRKI